MLNIFEEIEDKNIILIGRRFVTGLESIFNQQKVQEIFSLKKEMTINIPNDNVDSDILSTLNKETTVYNTNLKKRYLDDYFKKIGIYSITLDSDLGISTPLVKSINNKEIIVTMIDVLNSESLNKLILNSEVDFSDEGNVIVPSNVRKTFLVRRYFIKKDKLIRNGIEEDIYIVYKQEKVDFEQSILKELTEYFVNIFGSALNIYDSLNKNIKLVKETKEITKTVKKYFSETDSWLSEDIKKLEFLNGQPNITLLYSLKLMNNRLANSLLITVKIKQGSSFQRALIIEPLFDESKGYPLDHIYFAILRAKELGLPLYLPYRKSSYGIEFVLMKNKTDIYNLMINKQLKIKKMNVQMDIQDEISVSKIRNRVGLLSFNYFNGKTFSSVPIENGIKLNYYRSL